MKNNWELYDSDVVYSKEVIDGDIIWLVFYDKKDDELYRRKINNKGDKQWK